MNKGSQQTFVYKHLYLDVDRNEGDITFTVDNAFYQQDNYIFELIVEQKVIQSTSLTKEQLQKQVRIQIQDVKNFLNSFINQTQMIILQIRNPSDPSGDRWDSMLVCNPNIPTIIHLPYVEGMYLVHNAAILFDYNSLMAASDQNTIIVLNDKKNFKIRPFSIFFQPKLKIETESFNMIRNLKDRNKINVSIEDEYFSFNRTYYDIPFTRFSPHTILLELRPMIDKSFKALIFTKSQSNSFSTRLFLDENRIPGNGNGNQTDRDPRSGTIIFNIPANMTKEECYYKPKILYKGNGADEETFYMHMSSIIESVKVTQLDNCYAKIDFKLSIPVVSKLGHTLVIKLNGEEFEIREISSTEFSVDVLLCKILNDYNLISMNVVSIKPDMIKLEHKEVVYFHKSHVVNNNLLQIDMGNN